MTGKQGGWQICQDTANTEPALRGDDGCVKLLAVAVVYFGFVGLVTWLALDFINKIF